MKKLTLVALLALVLMAFGACTGTQDCVVTGIAYGKTYTYSYVDGDGNGQSGSFTAESSSYVISGVDDSVNCSDISIGEVLIAMTDGPVF